MTDKPHPGETLGRAYVSGFDDGAIWGATHRPAPQYTLGVPPAPEVRQPDIALRDDLNEWRRRAETAETALAEVRGQRDYAVTSLANMVDAAVKNSPDGTGVEWAELHPTLDTDGEPPLIADGTLAGTIRRLSGEPGTAGGGFEVRVRFIPGDRTRLGTGYAYRITLPFGPDGTPPEVIGND